MKIKHDSEGPRTVHECPDCKPETHLPKLSIKKVRDNEYDLIACDGDPVINCINPDFWEPIVRAVQFHQVLLNIAKNLDYKRHGKFDKGCEVCETIANAEKGEQHG
jgi:hypothetical protein